MSKSTKRLGRPPRGLSVRVTDDDREWFAARPGRQYRARPWVTGETPPFDWDQGNPYTIVRQARPGFRFRVPVGWLGPQPLEMASEVELERLWRLAAPPDLIEAAERLAGRW